MACKYLHIVSSITVNETGGNVTLNFSNPITSLEDRERFCFKIPCAVAMRNDIDGYFVLMAYNGSTIEAMNKYGNALKFGQLKKNKVCKGYYGTDSSKVIVSDLPVTYNCGCTNA